MDTLEPTDLRSKLLAITEKLIYEAGIAATGMDRIVKVSGIARKSIYRHFPTKEALVVAALAARDDRWMAWFIAASSTGTALPARVQAMFDALGAWFARPDFRGCAFINVAGEVGDAADAVAQLARAHKLRLLHYLAEVGRQGGLPAAQADALAHALLILIDGAVTVTLLSGDRAAAPRAARMASALLAAGPVSLLAHPPESNS